MDVFEDLAIGNENFHNAQELMSNVVDVVFRHLEGFVGKNRTQTTSGTLKDEVFSTTVEATNTAWGDNRETYVTMDCLDLQWLS